MTQWLILMLCALYFGDNITRTDNAMITTSVLTNAVEYVNPKKEFEPQASVVMLANIGKFYSSEQFLEPLYCFREFFNSVVASISNKSQTDDDDDDDDDDALEVAVSWWLRCRLAASHKVGMKSISLNRLFGLS